MFGEINFELHWSCGRDDAATMLNGVGAISKNKLMISGLLCLNKVFVTRCSCVESCLVVSIHNVSTCCAFEAHGGLVSETSLSANVVCDARDFFISCLVLVRWHSSVMVKCDGIKMNSGEEQVPRCIQYLLSLGVK